MLKSVNFWINLSLAAILAIFLVILVGKSAVNLNKDFASLEEENAKLTSKLNRLQDTFDILEYENKTLKEERQKFRERSGSLFEKTASLEKANGELTRVVQALKEESSILSRENSRLTEENEAIRKEYEAYKESMSGFDKKYSDLEAKFSDLRQEYDLLLDRGEGKLDRESISLEKKNTFLKNENKMLNRFISELHDKIKQNTKEKKDIAGRLGGLNEEMAGLIKERDRYKKEYEDALALLESQTNRSRDMEEEYSRLLRENKELRAKTRAIPRKLSELNKLNKEILKDKAVLHYNLGVFYTQSRDYRRALKEFEEVLKTNPDDSDAHYNLGLIYSEYIIDKDKAASHFRKYLGLAPSDEDADKARKYLLLHRAMEGE